MFEEYGSPYLLQDYLGRSEFVLKPHMLDHSESSELLHDVSPHSAESLAEGRAWTAFSDALIIQACAFTVCWGLPEQRLPSTRPCLPSLSLCPSDPELRCFFFLPLLPAWTFDQTIILASCSLILSGFFLVVFQVLGLWLWPSTEVQRKQISHVEMWRPSLTLGGGWFSSHSVWLGVGEPYMPFQVGQSLEYNAVIRRMHWYQI